MALPQATSRGMYGYRYIVESGQRRIEPTEAQVVRTVFDRFVAGESCNHIVKTLNASGVSAFGGGIWYPLTIRRMLLNESYTGRTVFRRTQAQKYRDSRTGKSKRTVSERDKSEWIERNRRSYTTNHFARSV